MKTCLGEKGSEETDIEVGWGTHAEALLGARPA